MSNRPTKQTLADTKKAVRNSLQVVRAVVPANRSSDYDLAFAEVETFVAMALLLMAKTNTSKVAAMHEEAMIMRRVNGGRNVLLTD
ncbi:MAG: hypothetical protein ACSLE8_06420 [Rhodococcus sp. (in: high G+C Gram-positive bacteria)]